MASRSSGMKKTKIMKISSASGVILQSNLSRALCTELVREFITLWHQAHFVAIYSCSANHHCLTLESSAWEGVDSAGKEHLWNPKSSAAECRAQELGALCPLFIAFPPGQGCLHRYPLPPGSVCAVCAWLTRQLRHCS